MQMTNSEIARDYKAAKRKKEQIEILADLNCCTKDDIKDILISEGVPIQGKTKVIAINEDLADFVVPDKLVDQKCVKASIPKFVVLATQNRVKDLNHIIGMLNEQLSEALKESAELENWLKEVNNG